MKFVHKMVAGLAVAGLAVSAAYAVRPFPKKVSNSADEVALGGVAAAALPLNISIGYEAAEGYPLGVINNVAGVYPAGCGGAAFPCYGRTGAANASLITPTISSANPFAGTQHLRVTPDPATRTNQPGFGLGVDARYPRTADLSVGPIDANTVSAMIAINSPFGQDFRIQPQSNSQGFLATSLLMYNSGLLYVLDDLCGGTALGFLPTGGSWDTTGAYQNYTVAMNPCNDTITYSYGGAQVYAGCVIAGSNLEQFLVFGNNFPGSTLDVDNAVLSSRPGPCPSICGNGIIEGPVETCEPGNNPTGCGPGHPCGAVGTVGECTCSRICTLDAPCEIVNGANGPFFGPFDAAFGGIFVYNSPAGVDAVSVELCGSTGIDQRILYFGSCTDPGDPGVTNDDCYPGYAGADPSASCYGTVTAPNYESCTCHDNPLAGDNCYLMQVRDPGPLGQVTVEVNKKATCGGGHLGACCDTNNREGGDPVGCTDNALQSACTGVDKVWTENGKCASTVCECIPDCTGRNCGDDGCGGSCGACGDALACNGVDTCPANGVCVTGPVPNCNDGIACTADSCVEPAGTCSNVPNNALCSNNNVCDGSELCVVGTGCTPNPGSAPQCDDGLFCTGVESCDPTLGCQDNADPCDPDREVCDEVKNQCEPGVIPTVSEWGLVVLTLMLLIGAKVYFGRRQVIA